MRNKRLIAEMNVVPYVDVMLVLVVILMVTAPMLNQGVNVDLPRAQAKQIADSQDLPIIVSVAQSGELYLNVSANPQTPIIARDLQTEVNAALVRQPNRKVLLKGDRSVSYETIMQAMVILQASGVDNIGLQTFDGEQ